MSYLRDLIKRDLRIKTTDTRTEREIDEYADRCGDEALARQVEEGKRRYRCCWEEVGGPHHPLCREANR